MPILTYNIKNSHIFCSKAHFSMQKTRPNRALFYMHGLGYTLRTNILENWEPVCARLERVETILQKI